MNLRPITREEAEVCVLAEPDDLPVKGNACVSGDKAFDREVEHKILCRLEQYDLWAWAAVTVIASWGPFEGKAYLGSCSYDDEEDFTQHSGYFDAMVAEALRELNRNVREAYLRIKEREKAA